MNFEPVPLMRDTSSFNRSTIVIDNMLLHFGKQDFIAQNMPNNAIPNLNTFFDGVIDALSGIDVNVLIKGIAGIGLLSAIMLALSAVASLVPGATSHIKFTHKRINLCLVSLFC